MTGEETKDAPEVGEVEAALRAGASVIAAVMGESKLPGAFPVDESDVALLNDLRPPDWRNPTPSGAYDLVVIGAGPGGMAALREAQRLGAKVALVERRMLGGECMNVGCIPSKTMIRTSRLYAEMDDAGNFGATRPVHAIDFPRAMARLRKLRQRLNHGASARQIASEGVDLYFGDARFTGRDAVSVEDTVLRFRKAVIATGARPKLPDIPGLLEAGFLSNETVFSLTEPPKKLLVIGGGPLGCEMAQAFRRLGVQVVIVQKEPTFLPGEEREAAQLLSTFMARDGIEIRLDSTVVTVRTEDGMKVADMVQDGVTSTVIADEILTGLGRSPNVKELGLDRAGIAFDEDGIKVDDHLRTTNPSIYAVGDVCLERKYTHVAAVTGKMAVANALRSGRKRLSDLIIPWCTYTDPEIAHVGLYAVDARRRKIPVKTFLVLMHDVPRAVMDGEEQGFVKFHVREGTDEILGATMVARHAGEMINTASLAIAAKVGLRTLGGIIHTFPTQAEAIAAAGEACAKSQLQPRWQRLWAACLARLRRTG